MPRASRKSNGQKTQSAKVISGITRCFAPAPASRGTDLFALVNSSRKKPKGI